MARIWNKPVFILASFWAGSFIGRDAAAASRAKYGDRLNTVRICESASHLQKSTELRLTHGPAFRVLVIDQSKTPTLRALFSLDRKRCSAITFQIVP